MSAQPRVRPRLKRPMRGQTCPASVHEYPDPISKDRRPVVVFCTRCQTAKTLT